MRVCECVCVSACARVQALVDMDVRCWDKGRSMWQFMMTRDGYNLRVCLPCHVTLAAPSPSHAGVVPNAEAAVTHAAR